jgi:hypothetical protein
LRPKLGVSTGKSRIHFATYKFGCLRVSRKVLKQKNFWLRGQI